MKLLYIHNVSLDSNNANIISTLNMCKSFSELGLKVSLAVPKPNFKISENELSSHIKNNTGIDINFSIKYFKKFKIFGRFNTIGGFWGIRNLLKVENTDLCFVRSPVFNITIDAGIPTIFECHNSLLNSSSQILDRFWKRKLRKISQYDRFLKLIAISNNLANYWQGSGIPSEKILALHDSIDEEDYKKVKSRKLSREQLKLPINKKLIIYAGSLYPDREIETILKLAKMHSKSLFFVLGGPEDQKKYYEGIVKTEGIDNINFMGHVPHKLVKNYLYAADVLLMIWSKKVPTINYCSPLKMFEYMASGRIIVGHGFPTIKEILVDGQTAYLADPDSFDDLSEKLKKALTDQYPSEMADNARKLALKEFTWKKRAETILKHATIALNIL